MTDTEKVEAKIKLRLKKATKLKGEELDRVAREINALAQTLISIYKAENYDKH